MAAQQLAKPQQTEKTAGVEKKKKETILDLSKYLEKPIRVKFSGGREASGISKGFDPLLNLVLDESIEYLRGVYHYLKQLFALPFLPSPHIAPAFDHLQTMANSPQLQKLVGYIERQWVRGTIFDVASWSVYQQTVRTNNDLEAGFLDNGSLYFTGWHHRLNQKAGQNIRFYKLVPLLSREAELVELANRGGDLSRRSRKKYKDIDAKDHNTLATVRQPRAHHSSIPPTVWNNILHYRIEAITSSCRVNLNS